MPKYQVQYKNESHTFTDIFYSESHLQIIDFFQNIINAELLEIREFVYENNFYPKDDGDYINSASCRLTGEFNTITSFKIPKLKKTVTTSYLTSLINEYIKINNSRPKTIKITHNF